MKDDLRLSIIERLTNPEPLSVEEIRFSIYATKINAKKLAKMLGVQRQTVYSWWKDSNKRRFAWEREKLFRFTCISCLYKDGDPLHEWVQSVCEIPKRGRGDEIQS